MEGWQEGGRKRKRVTQRRTASILHGQQGLGLQPRVNVLFGQYVLLVLISAG